MPSKRNQRERGWKKWIVAVLPYLRKIQEQGNTEPINAAMKFNDMATAYKNRFERDLLQDLNRHFNEPEKEKPQ